MKVALVLFLSLLFTLPAYCEEDKARSFTNNTPFALTGVYCIDYNNKQSSLLEAVPASATVTIPANNAARFGDEKCERLFVTTANAFAWQFYPEELYNAAAQGLTIDWQAVSPDVKEKRPALIITMENEKDPGAEHTNAVVPAGIPLGKLRALMADGKNVSKDMWRKIATPDAKILQDLEAFAVAFAGTSWDITKDGLIFERNDSGENCLESIRITAPFSIAALPAVFKELHTQYSTPWLFASGNTVFAFTDEGLKLAAGAKRLSGLDSDKARWERIDALIKETTGGNSKSPVFIVFGSTVHSFRFMYTIGVDTGLSAAVMTFSRLPENFFE